MTKAVVAFVAVAFGFSWTLAEVFFRVFDSTPLGYGLMAVAYMYGPALGALVATRYVLDQPLSWLGPIFGWNRWVVVAIATPFLFALAHVLIGASFPGISINADTESFTAAVLAVVPAGQRELVQAQLARIGDYLPWVLLAQVVLGGLLNGLSIGALAAFGEELGWRGFLHKAWLHVGFWRRAAMVGSLWGIWHAPLILRGHNYPQHPVEGVGMMVLFCLLWAPLFEHVRERSGVVLSAVLMHGVMNATATAMLFVSGGSDLLRGPAGLAGMLALLLGNLVVWWLRQGAGPQRAAA